MANRALTLKDFKPYMSPSLERSIAMVRPCFLVLDQEHAGSVSSRKLVLETAKFNVLTVFSCQEALQTLRLFPNVHGVVMDASTRDEDCASFFAIVKSEYPVPKLILVGECQYESCSYDYSVPSFSPAALLETLRQAFPEESSQIEQNERYLVTSET